MDYYITPVLVGGLGNRLFQIATAYVTAKDQGKKVIITDVYDNPHQTVDQEEIINLPRGIIDIHYNFHESGRFTDKLDIPNIQGNIKLHGFYQNEKYFDHHRNDILNMFRMSDQTRKYLTEKYPNVSESYFIHVRRGDYVGNGGWINLDYEKYISDALMYTGQSTFYVMSDDLEYCKNLNVLKSQNVIFVHENEVNCMYLMSLCQKGGICSNSTFSWWGYYLIDNVNKLGIYPDRWYQNGLEKHPSPNPSGVVLIKV